MIMDGRSIAKDIEQRLLVELQGQPKKRVAFVLVGENLASRQFVGIKTKVAQRLGIKTELYEHPESSSTQQILASVLEISHKNFDGIVVQLPLPSHIDTHVVLNSIPPGLDIDVLSDEAKNKFRSGELQMIPPVAGAVQEVLNHVGVPLRDKKILIVGKGKLVGEPVSLLFDRIGIPYGVIEKETDESEKAKLFRSADIVISGAGSSHFITPDMIQEGVVLIDAGTSELSGVLVGDIHPDCYEKASFATPVPGGIGPVTVVCLFKNIVH